METPNHAAVVGDAAVHLKPAFGLLGKLVHVGGEATGTSSGRATSTLTAPDSHVYVTARICPCPVLRGVWSCEPVDPRFWGVRKKGGGQLPPNPSLSPPPRGTATSPSPCPAQVFGHPLPFLPCGGGCSRRGQVPHPGRRG